MLEKNRYKAEGTPAQPLGRIEDLPLETSVLYENSNNLNVDYSWDSF